MSRSLLAVTDGAKSRIFWVAETVAVIAIAALFVSLIRTGDVPKPVMWTFVLVVCVCGPLTLWCNPARRRVRDERRENRLQGSPS
jgi:hypothetical protein